MTTAAGARPTSRRHDAATGPRLRWWALPLPVAVFALLLALLLLGGGQGSGGAAETASGFGQVASVLWEKLHAAGSA
ncbi:hypothetical protein GCM10023347_25410 [Streptomyces chumphonensis]|uniref:Uncharacterized protein n=1 Tax=Streptomyces chumphonensis TaxID=1214925 RepID=A0A927IAN6_9ACTN|nr:hypothetical protein [Streptomyces chumphonensis]MBD3929972.1 hypothetical protein [Streptomyces chumphonensis]